MSPNKSTSATLLFFLFGDKLPVPVPVQQTAKREAFYNPRKAVKSVLAEALPRTSLGELTMLPRWECLRCSYRPLSSMGSPLHHHML